MEEDDNEGFQLLCTLKTQVFTGDRLSDDYVEILKDLLSLVNENKMYLRFLERCNFMTDTLLLTLKFDCSHEIGFQFITELIKLGAKTPSYFYSKKFIFFITEKLYENMDDSATNVDFVIALIEHDRVFISILNECGYFSLVNSCITEKTAKLYSQIFTGFEEQKIKNTVGNLRKTQLDVCEDVMFEIQRKNFDSEIVFRDCGVISFKIRKSTFKKGDALLDELFDNLYKSNLYNLLDCSIESMLGVLSFKNIKCDWLLDEPIFIELAMSGDLSALRVLRNILIDCEDNVLIKLKEIGYTEKIVKLLEDKSQRIKFEAIIGLCSYITLVPIENYKPFTEKRIRSIFSLLEFSCSECPCTSNKCPTENDNTILDINNNLGNNVSEDRSCIYTLNPSLSDDVSTNIRKCSFTSKTAVASFLFPSDLPSSQEEATINVKCLENCETMKLLNLIFLIYHNHKKEYFYKMSYIILIKRIIDNLKGHRCFNKDLFYNFFEDFISFILSKDKNISRIMFPFSINKKKGQNKKDNNDLSTAEYIDLK